MAGRIETACVAVALFCPVLTLSAARAQTVGYWRMETDNDASPNGLQVPNETSGGSALTSSSAAVAAPVPVHPIPQTGAGNTFALDGLANINAMVAPYGALNTGSITIEFFARSDEGTATLIDRFDAGGGTGLRIHDPDDIQVDYYVEDGAGGTQLVQMDTNLSLSSSWKHFAFTYDQASGDGKVYVDGGLELSDDGAPGLALVWPAAQQLLVADDFDGNNLKGSGGIFDELRISATALGPGEFLNVVPEPATLTLVWAGLLGLAGRRRRR
jgi:hypothetical protein